jgi:hypothetical protein
MGALDKLKKNRSALFEKVSKDFESKGGNFEKKEDDRFWQPTRNKDGNGAAIIRFLPPVAEGDELPWARLYSYAFKGPTGKWYIENALSTIGQKDPVGEYNHEKWEESLTVSGAQQKLAQDAVRNRKRKTTFISNILVVRDPAKPECEGKVFLYKYGTQIHGMIEAKGKPEKDEFATEDPVPVYVYDAFEGANFRLKVKMKDKYPTYEDSKFEDNITALCDGDEEEMERVLSSAHQLNAFTAPDQFKSYEELQKLLVKVLNLSGASTASSGGESAGKGRSALESMDDDATPPAEDKPKAAVTKVATKTPPKKVEAAKVEAEPSGEEDETAFFRDLLKD